MSDLHTATVIADADLADDNELPVRKSGVAGLLRLTLAKIKTYLSAAHVLVPPGGTTGQVLKKISGTDGDIGWGADNVGSGGATTLDGLTDVDTSTVAPTNGQVLKFDSTAGLWKPGADATGGGTPWYWSPPVAANFTAVSHDATMPTAADDADVGMLMTFGNTVTGDKTRALWFPVTTPAADWTLITRINWQNPRYNFIYGALAVKDNAGGKILNFGPIEDAGGGFTVSRLPGLTTSAGSGPGLTFGNVREYWKFYKIHFDNATGNITGYLSMDGKNWQLMWTENYATYLGAKPTHVGFAITSNQGSGYPLKLSSDMWKFTQP